MISILSLIIILFAAFALSRAALRLRDRRITFKEFAFWLLIWAGVIAVAIYPQMTSWVSQLVGVSRGADLLIYVGVLLLFYLVFRLYVKLDGLSQDLTRLTRAVAIKHPRKRAK